MRGRFVSVRGSHAEMGFELGRQCRDGVASALRHLYDELAVFISNAGARSRAEAYAPVIESRAPHLMEELTGLAEGAGISLAEALILQLRFELVGFDGRGGEGCTSFAIVDHGIRLTGQNVDAPVWHKALGIVVEMQPTDGPSLLMYTYYPGMIGYLGINSAGVSVFGNAVVSPGWRVGFPRYLGIRLALEQESVAAAHDVVATLERASTINLVISDRHHDMIDLELDVDEVGVVEPRRGRLFHTNHYLNPTLQPKERLLELLPDSAPRLAVAECIVNDMSFETGRAKAIEQAEKFLSDHSSGSSSICRHAADVSSYPGDQWESVASIVAEPDHGRMAVCFGNPCNHPYETFEFSAERDTSPVGGPGPNEASAG